MEGQKVVDLGAGRGYFTIKVAEIIGSSGFLYSVEPDQTRSNRIRERLSAEGLSNVRVLTTGAEHMEEIPSDTVDLAFSVFSLHHFTDRHVSFAEIRRILRQGGVFYVWDRVPGVMLRHGTRPDELDPLVAGFSSFELIDARGTLKAKLTK